MKDNKVDLFLDSGAFSAWTQGASINIDEYIQFIKDNIDVIDVYANLDVIGLGGKQPNELTAKKTLENQKIMEKAGLKPLPCYHFGEPESYLDYYVKNYDYLALGVAGNSGMKLTTWLDRCFLNHICDDEGYPKVKVHGFAVTSVRIMIKYPWYSVDSTSWVVSSRMGGVFIPQWIDDKWSYDTTPAKILVSSKSPYSLRDKEVNLDEQDWGNKSAEKGKHFSTLTLGEQKRYLRYIHEKGYVMGTSEFVRVPKDHVLAENESWAEKKDADKSSHRLLERITEPGISNTYQMRDEMNIIYFLDLEKSRPKWPWAFKVENIQQSML